MAREKKNWYALDEGWGAGESDKTSVRKARKQAIQSGAKTVNIYGNDGRFLGTVVNNKKLGASFWSTTTKSGKTANYVIAKDGSLIGYAGKKTRTRVTMTLDDADPVKEKRAKYNPRTSKKGRRKYDFAWDME